MKNYMFRYFALAMAVGFSAFTTKSAKKPFATTTYYYVTGTVNQRVQPGFSDPGTPENSVTSGFFKNVAKWSTTATSFTQTSDCTVSYIASIQFNLDNTTDGDNDHALTLQEAIDAVWSSYISSSPNDFRATVIADSNNDSCVALINVAKASAAH